eukprot:9999559-Lingulodinium_polyedra.AAC.1
MSFTHTHRKSLRNANTNRARARAYHARRKMPQNERNCADMVSCHSSGGAPEQRCRTRVYALN